MIFLSAVKPNVSIRVYGTEFVLNPVPYPKVNTDHILVAEDALGKRILERNGEKRLQRIFFEAEKLPGFPKPFSINLDLAPSSKVLIIRGGGIGDVLTCTPAIRELRKRLPRGARLKLATFGWNFPFFSENPFLDGVTSLPLTLTEMLDSDSYVEFADSHAGCVSMIDYYLAGLGLDPKKIADKSLVLNVGPLVDQGTADNLNTLRSSFRYLVYLNGLASDRLRDLPPETLQVLPERFPNIAFLSSKLYVKRYDGLCREMQNRRNVILLDTDHSIGVYVTALLVCDAVVTTDSSASHIAAALKKPCVTLFGPGRSETWASHYPTVRPLEAAYTGRLCTSPCGQDMLSGFGQNQVVSEKRCPEAIQMNRHFSPCLSSVSPERLTEAFNEALKSVLSFQKNDLSFSC